MEFNYNNRYFTSLENSGTGEVSGETIFHYRQKDDLVWATYHGGKIKFGALIAQMEPDGHLDMRYQHVNSDGKFMSGLCKSIPEVLPDGRYRVHESWQWTSGDESQGTSVIEELPAEKVPAQHR
jgi:hypothetical protein